MDGTGNGAKGWYLEKGCIGCPPGENRVSNTVFVSTPLKTRRLLTQNRA